jgi:anaerobic dimethyl sulfoxide reductase subunit B (iron-sulfur subunit)
MTYAFTFDASACSGCKACQIACKDKNNLPTGVLWRRVFEVSGGSWTNIAADDARLGVWQTDVFAYNLSIACNHCVHPKCAGVCPTDAYVVRPDGIVYIDESKCMGCGYCAWACPYAVPQYNPDLRQMSKCNFCFDNLDAGLPPACVAACPLRVLDYEEISEERTESSYQALWQTPATEHPFPLPAFSRTQPHLAIKPHAGMLNGLEKVISNREETQTQRTRSSQSKIFENLEEVPLVAFTLLAQMSAGMAAAAVFSHISFLHLLAIGFLLGLGGLISFLHLGTKKNAWRAIMHLQKSWLSREILMVSLFGASWLVSLAENWFLKTDTFLPVTAIAGLGLVYSMAQVYRFKAAPAWNTWRTNATFFLSTASLGLAGIAFGVGMAEVAIPLSVVLATEGWLRLTAPHQLKKTADRLRLGLIATAVAAALITLVIPSQAASGLMLPIFLLVLTQEIIGRWLFYEMRQPAL